MSTNSDCWRRIVLAVDDSISIADVRQFLRTFGHAGSLTLVNVAHRSLRPGARLQCFLVVSSEGGESSGLAVAFAGRRC
jgi:hypothetical protein